MIDVEIRNVVAVATLRQGLDLIAILDNFVNVKYDPNEFPGLVFRLKRQKTTTLIFKTGKMVCTGAKSTKMAMSALRKVIKELRKTGFIIWREPETYVTNIVASADICGEVDLEEVADVLYNVMYEPEQFPGAIYRMVEPKVVVLIFASGKLVIVGAKREEQAYEAAERIRAVLMENGLLY